jgi:hypothetical protein
MVASGDISELKAKLILEERERVARLMMSKARYEGWVDQWRRGLMAVLKPMTYEIQKVRAQRRYAHEVGNDVYAGLLEKYESVLKREVNRIMLDFEADPHKYKSIKENWWDLVSDFGLESLRDRWITTQKEVTGNMKVPELLARRK